eukprot:gnl/TRDRNA2_/TRDRNA2_198104_c0_seq1.p1 gnl/TRDRNA2_/TRDRNA2_198104_c0~~gnl/TRDRNA2_/TRDRNA2_198104_c0_seq1.p1  ORF type:complete len:297 (-),score=26.12 gnl/TRDRNA2_/TRDRNA2_198104_c0_seq1:41-931(-)
MSAEMPYPERGDRGPAGAQHAADDIGTAASGSEREDDDEANDALTTMFQVVREELVAVFPHECAIMARRQLETGSCMTSLLIAHCTYLVCSQPSPDTWLDRFLQVLCCIRVLCFIPRPRMWLRSYRLYGEARNQPTPQLVRERVAGVMYWSPPGERLLNTFYYTWLVLAPSIVYFGPQTEFASKFRAHVGACYIWLFMSRMLNAILFYWLQSSKINRGASRDFVREHTEVFSFKQPWKRLGDPECAICLLDYQADDSVRVLSCGHHFHVQCVDRWLLQYVNYCPCCRASLSGKKDE